MQPTAVGVATRIAAGAKPYTNFLTQNIQLIVFSFKICAKIMEMVYFS